MSVKHLLLPLVAVLSSCQVVDPDVAGSCDATTPCSSGKQCCDGFCRSSCGTDGGSGSCVAGRACSTNPTPCRSGVTQCEPTAACVDGSAVDAGTSCGANQICSAQGTCSTCVPNAPCTGNPGVCRAGVTSCATGTAVCIDGINLAEGLLCGTDQVCRGGTCVMCVSGEPCSTNPTACRAGVTDCGTGVVRCVDGSGFVSAGQDPAMGCGLFTCGGAGACATSCSPTQPCAGSAFCIGGQCVARLPDGEPCATPGQCQSGMCVALFVDGDGDGFGAGASSMRCSGTTAPTGYSLTSTDCCDADRNAFPGQTAFFTTAMTACAGGFDYDCSGTATTQFEGGACQNDNGCPDNCNGIANGFSDPVVACGVTASFVTVCNTRTIQMCTACFNPTTVMRTQACR
ncbi:MAG: hypothetical protein QM817_17235 [Archangium sp.]